MKTLTFLLVIVAFLSDAFGDCSTPAGKPGQMQWVPSSSKVLWCNGTNWVDPVVNPGLSCSDTTQGTIHFDSGEAMFCDGLSWQGMGGLSLDSCLGNLPGTIHWDPTRFIMKYCDGGFWRVMYANSGVLPQLSSLSINGGAPSTKLNNVKINLSAASGELALKITHFCLKYSTSGAPPAAPGPTDSCWVALNLPSPGISPEEAVSFSNFYYPVGFTPGTYTIYGWVKNGLDTISALTNSGNGSNGVDMASIVFDPGAPPTLNNVFATNSDSASVPPTSGDLFIPAGNDVFIKWKLTDDDVLPGAPVEIFYTTNEDDFYLIASNVPNAATPGCTVDGINSTGCYKWTNGAPTNGYFRIRVKAMDDSSLSSISSSEANNMGSFKILAGTTDPGLGGSAASAVIFYTNPVDSFISGVGGLVVRSNGMMFVVDDRGLMAIDPEDGVYKIFLPYTGTRTDGPLGTATLKAKPIKIALDFKDRLLIYDQDRIRRVDFTTNQVTSVIGGGNLLNNGTSAADFKLDPVTGIVSRSLFVPLPNGDLWFQTEPDFSVNTRSDGSKIRIYRASDDKIYTWIPSGTGSLEDPAFDPSNVSLHNFGLSFNPISSSVTAIRSRSVIPNPSGYSARSVRYDPSTGATMTPHIPYLGHYSDDNTITSMNGEMYGVDRVERPGIFKYNPSTNSWNLIVGNLVKGQCADGTPALSCSVEVTDAFINSSNQIFFIDRGRIRTVDANGNVITLFGQSRAFGDGGFAASARVNEVLWLDITAGGKIAFIDNKELVIREFTPDGVIQKIAGTGADSGPNTTDPAVTQPIIANYWGGNYPMVADPATGTIYYTRNGNDISKLDRSTGKWVQIVGGGGYAYWNGDGRTGLDIALEGYNSGPIGFNGSQLLRHNHAWNGTDYYQSYVKAYSIADGTQSAFAGNGIIAGGLDCGDGTPLASCAVPTNYNILSRAHWDAPNNRWLLHQNGSSIIRTATPGGNWGTLAGLPRGFGPFTQVMKGADPYIYYCSSSRVYKYNLNTSVETALPWPTTTMHCSGHSMVWHSTRQSIVFPIQQNGLGGVAEIYDP